ncbi:phosphoglycerate kinase [Candidatus Parcubacteria bacterium]|nr:phosphoglycerate kinase [Candidatus Parcubacteria bacterium]
MKLIKKIKNLKNKKILIRVDFNVPVGDDGIVDNKEDWRIKAALPTIEYLLEKEAKIILISHLGRPEGNQELRIKNQEYSLRPVAERLEELLDCKIKFIDDCVGDKAKDAVEKMRAGEIILLENLRFYKEEKNNGEKFAKELSKLADIYVNDAFSVSHRAHASISAITKFLPSYAGLLLGKEVKILSDAINNSKGPVTVIIGGAKVKTKVPVIEYLMNKVDHILVGGVVANVILKAKGIDTGKSLMDGIDIKEVREINLGSNKLYVPVDAVVYNSKSKKISLQAIGKVGDNKILDIGTESANLYSKIISDSKTIIWNGPMGMFEDKNFSFGTREIAKAVVESDGYTIIGGGDTIMALDQLGYLNKMDYICTGGGAMLEFLAGEKLPGLEALE